MDNLKNEILLSICIPTFNRADILRKTLESHVKDPAFDDRVEIVISDNCSTDHTRDVSEFFVREFGNIVYNRNDENIRDGNFAKVLSLGNGKYLKLMNDTVTFKTGALQSILETLEAMKEEMKPVFFYNNIDFLHSNTEKHILNLNELISSVSFWITWIANFGIWKIHFERIEDKGRLAHLKFTQVDWTIRLIIKKKIGTLIFRDYYDVAVMPNKGGYNLFQTFGVDYLSIYEQYLKSGLLSKKIFNIEKYRLFRYFIMNWYYSLVLSQGNSYTFEKRNAWRIMINKYRYKPYFYMGIYYLHIVNFVKVIYKSLKNGCILKYNRF